MNIIIIPARLESTRLPGKLLLDKTGKPLIQHTYEAACKSRLADYVCVVTDDNDISLAVAKAGGEGWIDGTAIDNGTMRCWHGIEIMKGELHPIGDTPLRELVIVNWQADEPCLSASVADAFFWHLRQAKQQVGYVGGDRANAFGGLVFATPLAITASAPLANEDKGNENVVKVVSNDFRSVHFSRAAMQSAEHHIGIYGFNYEWLMRYSQAPPNAIEAAERLEQLRVVGESEMQFTVFPIPEAPISINTAEDYEKFVDLMKVEATT